MCMCVTYSGQLKLFDSVCEVRMYVAHQSRYVWSRHIQYKVRVQLFHKSEFFTDLNGLRPQAIWISEGLL